MLEILRVTLRISKCLDISMILDSFYLIIASKKQEEIRAK